MIYTPTLYDYQSEMKTQIDNAFLSFRSVMVQMPTGTGKTHILSAVINEYVQDNNQSIVWIVAHRKELVAQIERTLGSFGIEVNHKNPENCQVRVYSIQWLSRHLAELNDAPTLIVVDEAHHALAKTYSAVLDSFPSARKLGLTATPCRLNGKGFYDLFDTLLVSGSINDFIKKGYLSPFDYVSISSDSEEIDKIDHLVKRAADGDYNISEMSEVLDTRPSIERLYQSIRDFAPNKKGIVYAINIEHALHIAEYYSSKGLKAECISSKTSDNDRERLVNEFREGNLQILVNVDIFSEGFDCPDVEFIQMARPTLSLAKYLQQVGRGLRVFEGKKCCILLDNVGLYRLFGLPTDGWNWQAMFDGKQKGKGEVCDERINYMQMQSLSMRGLADTTPDNKTGMVVLTRHEELQEKIELFNLIAQIGIKMDGLQPLRNGWVSSSIYIQRGQPYQLFKKVGSRKFGRELVVDAKGIFYTFKEQTEELIQVGYNDPWTSNVAQYIRTNPNLTNDIAIKIPHQLSLYINKPQLLGTDDVHFYNGTYYLAKGKMQVTHYFYDNISKAKEGVRVFKDFNGKLGVMNQDGTYYLLWNKSYIDIQSDGVAYVKDSQEGVKRGRWINLYTMQEFYEKPEVVKFGFLRTLKVGEVYYLLEARMMAGIPLRREDFVFNDNVFQFFSDYIILKENPQAILLLNKSYRNKDGLNYRLTEISITNKSHEDGYISISKLPMSVSL